MWFTHLRRKPDVRTHSVEAEERAQLVFNSMAKLRDEVNGWILSQTNVMRTLIAGIAAIIVLGDDIDVARYLPLAPVLAVLLLTQYTGSLKMEFRAGWSMAVHEARINALANDRLLDHEITLWARRTDLHSGKPMRVLAPAAVVIGSVCHLALVAWTMRTSDLGDSSATVVLIWLAALVVTAFAIANCVQIRSLFTKLDDPEVHARTYESGSSPI